MAEYRDLVKKGKERFKKELESILPDVKSGERLAGMCVLLEANRIGNLQIRMFESMWCGQVYLF